jgi:Helix-turn-helix domain
VREPWLTKRELAAHLKVSTRTVERLRLPFLRVGGQNRYRLSEVEATLGADEDVGEHVVLHPVRTA